MDEVTRRLYALIALSEKAKLREFVRSFDEFLNERPNSPSVDSEPIRVALARLEKLPNKASDWTDQHVDDAKNALSSIDDYLDEIVKVLGDEASGLSDRRSE